MEKKLLSGNFDILIVEIPGCRVAVARSAVGLAADPLATKDIGRNFAVLALPVWGSGNF